MLIPREPPPKHLPLPHLTPAIPYYRSPQMLLEKQHGRR